MKPILVAHAAADVQDTMTKLERVGIQNPVRTVHGPQQLLDYLEGRNAFADRTSHPSPVIVILDPTLAANRQWQAAQKKLTVKTIVPAPDLFDFAEKVNMTKGIILRSSRDGSRVEEIEL